MKGSPVKRLAALKHQAPRFLVNDRRVGEARPHKDTPPELQGSRDGGSSDRWLLCTRQPRLVKSALSMPAATGSADWGPRVGKSCNCAPELFAYPALMEKIERNNRIVALKRQGMSIPAIAARIGLSTSTVRYIIETQEDRFHRFPIPEGISLRAARAVLNAIGHWPTPQDAKQIASRRRDLLRSGSVRSKDLKEVDAWLAWVENPDTPDLEEPVASLPTNAPFSGYR